MFAVFLTAFASCTDTIDVEMKNNGKLITIDAFLTTLRQDQRIRLTYTDNYFSGMTPPSVTGATVILKDLGTNRIVHFADNGNGNYIYRLSGDDTLIHANHSYELTVKCNGYEYFAAASCYRSPAIDDVYFEYKSASGGSGGESKGGNVLMLRAKDAVGPVPDFYWIKSFKNGRFYNRPENIRLEYFGFNNELDGGYFNPDVWSTSGPGGSLDPCISGDVARIEIHGISREVLEFLNLGKQMSNNGGLFATTPVNLPTNIFPSDKSYPRAVGMFSISEVSFKELVSQ